MNHTINSPNQIVLHGVFVEVLDLGVLIKGASAVGKSELALELVDRGHRLIADDSVLLTKTDTNQVEGKCPPVLQDFLEIRGLGVVNVRTLYGDKAIRNSMPLHLIIHLLNANPDHLEKIDRLSETNTDETILGVNIPQITLPIKIARNLAIFVEVGVRNQLLKRNGYNANREFIARQHTFMNKVRKNYDC